MVFQFDSPSIILFISRFVIVDIILIIQVGKKTILLNLLDVTHVTPTEAGLPNGSRNHSYMSAVIPHLIHLTLGTDSIKYLFIMLLAGVISISIPKARWTLLGARG